MKIRAPRDAVTKMITGIRGFDEITDGGLPRGRTTLVIGRGIIATPILLKLMPAPPHRSIGNLSEIRQLLLALGVR